MRTFEPAYALALRGPLDETAFLDAFYALTARHLPLRLGRDTIHVAPEDARYLPDDARLGSVIDPNLRHLEMRLQVWS